MNTTKKEPDEQEEEILVLQSIFDENIFMVNRNEKGWRCGRIFIHPALPKPYCITVPIGNGKGEQKIEVEHLEPLIMEFELSPSYPASSAPAFKMSCKWLTPLQMSKLCKHLDKIWKKGDVVIYNWIEFLQEKMLTSLRIEDSLPLDCLIRHLGGGEIRATLTRPIILDRRVHLLKMDPNTLVPDLTAYDFKRKKEIFDAEWFSCKICFASKQGHNFITFPGCGHFFCKECMQEFFKVQIESGCSSFLRCPEEGCSSQPLPNQVRELVGDKLFQKYDEFLFSTFLDTMANIVYCPRTYCSCPVELDPGSAMGTCPSCHFSFCVLCKMVYHGVAPCRLKPGQKREIREKYLQASEQEKLEMEKQYGRRTLHKLIDDSLTEEWLQENSKKCPHCNAAVEKAEGCNKMTCWRCGTYFCWLCMSQLRSTANPYGHFNDPNSQCFNKLFEGVEGVEDFDDVPEMGEFL